MSKYPCCKAARVVALLVFCLALGVGSVAAQTAATAGQIVGTVRDPNGAFVANATVTIASTDTGLERTFTTNEDGTFRAVQLPPGTYTLTINAPGFGAFTQTGYKVEVGSALDAQITLQVNAVTEEVLVTAASVETTQVQTPTVLNQTSISQLPINGRRFQDFVLLTPTAQTDPVRNQISLVGQRGINANVQIDGADYNNPFFGGIRGGERSNNAPTIPQSAIREFQVVASGYNAEFGRSTGGIVNAVTKSGTNDYNGSGFYLVRPADLAHRNAFGQVASPTQHQFGGAFGGPIIRNKAFFFGSYEQQELSQERAVLFNNLNLVSSSVTGIGEAFNFYRGLEGPYTQTNDAKVFLVRTDFNFSDRNQFNVRYNFSTNTALNAVTAGTSLQATTNSALSNNGTEGDKQHTFVGQLTSSIGANKVNELRGQYSRENRPRIANEISPLVNNVVGSFGTVSFLPTTQFDTRFQINDNFTITTGNHTIKLGGEYNRTYANQVFAFRQTGNFAFQNLGGADAATVTTLLRILTLGNAGGTGDPANRFDDTRVTYTRAIGNGEAEMTAHEPALFAQDSWRIRPNFTINFGLRWEAQFMPEPDTSNTALVDAVRNALLPLGNVDPTHIPDQVKQFAPRLGFAWDPWNDGRTVVRGFGGLYYARTPLLTLAGPINNFRTPPGDVALQLSGFTNASTAGTACANVNSPACPNTIYKQFLLVGIDLNTTPLNQLPILTVQQVQQINAAVSAARGITFNPLSGLQLVTVGGDQFRNPRSVQFGAAFEREVSRGLTFGATFDYVNTVNLNRNRDVDLPAPVVRANDRSLRPVFGIQPVANFGANQNRPISALGNLGYLQIREASARSLYRALTVRGQLRRSWGQFDAFYVLSKNLDDDSTERNATFAEYDNSFDLRPEYSFSRLDRRHQFVYNLVFDGPLGFQFSSTGRFLSSPPIDVSVSGIVAPFGSGLSNAQYAAQVTLSGNTTGDLNQDRGNFSDRPFIAPGVSLPRNAFRNRPFRNVDMRIQRDFRFGERFQISPSFEVFNVFKFDNISLGSTTATNYGNPGVNERTGELLTPSNVNFLRVRSATTGDYLTTNNAGAPLQMQIGVRVQF